MESQRVYGLRFTKTHTTHYPPYSIFMYDHQKKDGTKQRTWEPSSYIYSLPDVFT